MRTNACNSKAKKKPLKGQCCPQAPGALQLSYVQHRETGWPEDTLQIRHLSQLLSTHLFIYSPIYSSTYPAPTSSPSIPIHPSPYPDICVYPHASMSHPFPHLSIHPPTHPPTHLPTHPSTQQLIHLQSFHPSIHRVTHSPIHPPTKPKKYLLSIYYEPCPLSNNIHPPMELVVKVRTDISHHTK